MRLLKMVQHYQQEQYLFKFTMQTHLSNLTVTEKIVVINNMARSKLIVDWQPVDGVTQYLVNYKFENGNFILKLYLVVILNLLDTQKGDLHITSIFLQCTLVLSANSTEKTFVAQR